MNIRFYRNPETDEPHIYGHGVDEEEVADVPEIPEKIVRAEKERGSLLVRHAQDVTSG